jgi:DNA (cytosine-5)-methyltransferase 1
MSDNKPNVYRTIDLCAGIGGIRRGFELTGRFRNVLSAETDKYARKTYEHLYHVDPDNDVMSDEFLEKVRATSYDVLCAGFPCQAFSSVGLEDGFSDKDRGTIFFHIAKIMKHTRPKAIFLENVENLIRHKDGSTFRTIIKKLEIELGYSVVGVTRDASGQPDYDGRTFIRNSRDFGIPQNRPRTYIVAFDCERYGRENLEGVLGPLPDHRDERLYEDLRDVLELGADKRFYLSSGLLQTLKDHKTRQKASGNGFGYKVVNADGIEKPFANTIMATGGSGKERNLVYDPQEQLYGIECPPKRSPLNSEGIRFMTPREWGKLQGFIGYAFLEDGTETFSFPPGISLAQQYKQFGNSVTIPVIRSMAEYIVTYLDSLESVQAH